MKGIKEFLSDPLNWFIIWFFIYIFCGIVTFGHAFNNGRKEYISDWTGKPMQYTLFERTFTSCIAAAGWPLYVSTQLQMKEEK